MNFKFDGTLLSVVSKPYNVNGNSGISHKALVLLSGVPIELKTTEALVKEFSEFDTTEGKIEISITGCKLDPVLTLVGFAPFK